MIFQSTPPVWGATTCRSEIILEIDISIHAPRVGGATQRTTWGGQDCYISIHAPRVGGDGPGKE